MNKSELPLAPLLIKKLKETPQNPRFHAEGDVLRHTQMVVEQFYAQKDRFSLTPQEEKILYWASVLHDVGKPEVTRWEKGRWRATGHERAGMPVARDILLQNPEISAEERRKILDIVRWHGVPLHWSLLQRPISELKLLSTATDLRMLGIFCLFDIHGRIAEDQKRTVELLERFLAVEVPRVHYEFGKHQEIQARYAAWNLKIKNAAWNAFGMQRADLLEKLLTSDPAAPQHRAGKVWLTIGPPLAGKTQYLDQHFPDAFRVDLADFMLNGQEELDEFALDRKVVEFKYMLGIYIRHHQEVIIEGRNVDDNLRKRLNVVFRELNVEIHYLIFEASLESLITRNHEREQQLEEELIREAYQKFASVHPWEAHKMIWVEQ